VAAVIEPDILRTQLAYCDIEVNGELTRGRTVCDFGYAHRKPELTANVDVGTGIDRERFVAILDEAFRRTMNAE
jgi:inosine-uridine nucleoside N-ribohydrolase